MRSLLARTLREVVIRLWLLAEWIEPLAETHPEAVDTSEDGEVTITYPLSMQ